MLPVPEHAMIMTTTTMIRRLVRRACGTHWPLTQSPAPRSRWLFAIYGTNGGTLPSFCCQNVAILPKRQQQLRHRPPHQPHTVFEYMSIGCVRVNAQMRSRAPAFTDLLSYLIIGLMKIREVVKCVCCVHAFRNMMIFLVFCTSAQRAERSFNI